MGELRQRGRIWWIRYYRNGRRFEESSHSEKWAEADRLLKDREGDIAKGMPITAAIGRLRFEEAAADMLTEYQINGRKSYKDVKHRIEDGLGRGSRAACSRVSRPLMFGPSRPIASTRRPRAATINRELAALKRMYSLAIQAGKILRRPYIPMLQEDNIRKGFFERAQFEAVRAICRRGCAGWRRSRTPPAGGPRARSCRSSGIRWIAMPGRSGSSPGAPKTARGACSCSPAWWTYRRRSTRSGLPMRRWRPKGRCVRTCSRGRTGPPSRVSGKRGSTACAAAGCPGKIPHDFRRTAVRNLSRAGVPDTIAMKLTGHKTRSVFDRYDITSEEDLAEAARKLQTLAGTISGTIAAPTLAPARKPHNSFNVLSGPPGDRTQDHLIKSQVLYH